MGAVGGVLTRPKDPVRVRFRCPYPGGATMVSVMVQVSCFKYYRRFRGVEKRVFLRTPLHHHFEKLGWYESKIVARFYILGVLCAVMALASLKLR